MVAVAVLPLLAGCLGEASPQPTPKVYVDVCDEDHLTLFVAPQSWPTDEPPVEMGGLHLLSWYRFNCGEEFRELIGLELESQPGEHRRLLLHLCGDWFGGDLSCKHSVDFDNRDGLVVAQHRTVWWEEHILNYVAAPTQGDFAGYTSYWVSGNRTLVTQHSIGDEVASGTVTITPIPFEHVGIVTPPANPLHMVGNVTLQYAWQSS